MEKREIHSVLTDFLNERLMQVTASGQAEKNDFLKAKIRPVLTKGVLHFQAEEVIGKQAFTKNPLAEPYVLGISSGASLGAVLAMLLGVSLPVLGRLSVSAGAFAGALVSILLVYLLARNRNAVTPIRLILAGVAVSAMFQALNH